MSTSLHLRHTLSRAARVRRVRGFSLVEVAIVLVVAGLVSWAAFTAFDTVSEQQEREGAMSLARQMQGSLRAFAMRHGRLPCPDSGATATGYESLTGGNCTAGNQVGWFPYVALDMEVPQESLRARYAVFRAASATLASDADLAVAVERTGDAAGDATQLDVTDLIVGLGNAASLALSTSRAHLTGDAGPAGAIDCAANTVMPVAYWLVLPLHDRSGDGLRLDPPHTAAGLCAASPNAPIRSTSDDVVLAESPAQLAGWLRRSMP
ncbi:type II secretion system protein [Hydrogenophaga luteola]|uniref:Type II secretion system protein n=1 Tax=Hydrogenophaga luteola TaxID=1591122 RepID=A0ABV7WAU6_9BURK